MLSLFLVFEGSADVGPIPICRIADEGLTRHVVEFAFDKAKRSAEAMRAVGEDALSEANCEVDRLRAVLAVA